MKEWHRTVALLVILAVLVGMLLWLRTGYEDQALNILQ
jgi:hypothetical protein